MNIFWSQQFLLFLLISIILFSGCSSQNKNDTPYLFVPKAPLEKTSDDKKDSIISLPYEKENNEGVLQRDGIEYFLKDEESAFGQHYKLYRSTSLITEDNTEKFLYILEIWENGEKIFFFEETQPEQFSQITEGMPSGLYAKNKILFLEEKETDKEFIYKSSFFDISTYFPSFLMKIVIWKNADQEKGNNLVSITRNGGQYLFDPLSYADSFRVYAVIDKNKPFYVKSSGLENLRLITQIPIYEGAKVVWEERYDGVFFWIEEKNPENGIDNTSVSKEVLYEYLFSGDLKKVNSDSKK